MLDLCACVEGTGRSPLIKASAFHLWLHKPASGCKMYPQPKYRRLNTVVCTCMRREEGKRVLCVCGMCVYEGNKVFPSLCVCVLNEGTDECISVCIYICLCV